MPSALPIPVRDEVRVNEANRLAEASQNGLGIDYPESADRRTYETLHDAVRPCRVKASASQ
jgi:hypothetical protein